MKSGACQVSVYIQHCSIASYIYLPPPLRRESNQVCTSKTIAEYQNRFQSQNIDIERNYRVICPATTSPSTNAGLDDGPSAGPVNYVPALDNHGISAPRSEEVEGGTYELSLSVAKANLSVRVVVIEDGALSWVVVYTSGE